MAEQLTFDSVMKGFCGPREIMGWCCPECGKWLSVEVQVHECWRTGYTILQKEARVVTITPNSERWEYILAQFGLGPNGQPL